MPDADFSRARCIKHLLHTQPQASIKAYAVRSLFTRPDNGLSEKPAIIDMAQTSETCSLGLSLHCALRLHWRFHLYEYRIRTKYGACLYRATMEDADDQHHKRDPVRILGTEVLSVTASSIVIRPSLALTDFQERRVLSICVLFGS